MQKVSAFVFVVCLALGGLLAGAALVAEACR